MAGKLEQAKVKRAAQVKRASRLASMGENRKRRKREQRAAYHSEFKRQPGRRGSPRGNALPFV